MTRISKRERLEVWEIGQKPKTPFLIKLVSIRSRCNSPSNVSYKQYGGKGIKCNLTIEDLIFLWKRDKAWLLKYPSIDRIDTKGNYERNNCRYIERFENATRKTPSRRIKQMDLNGNIVKIWESVNSAISIGGFNKGNLYRVIGKKHLVNGYYFAYFPKSRTS